MITAGRLPLALGRARTALMRPPRLTVVGFIPVDFFATMSPSDVCLAVRLNPSSLSPWERGSQGRAARLYHRQCNRIFRLMNLKDGSTIVADLTTIGRKSGQPRTVKLRFAYFNGNFYASSTKVKGKHWC